MTELVNTIINNAVRDTNPYDTVFSFLKDRKFGGRVFAVAVGKAAAPMAKGAYDALGDGIYKGLVVTKYGHADDVPASFRVFESGHPVPDENSFRAVDYFCETAKEIMPSDTVIALVSGGASALFEKSAVGLERSAELTDAMLKSGMTINEMNCVRKHLSLVKGGGFIGLCNGARVVALILSDVIGDKLDVIGSGLTVRDTTSAKDAEDILKKYGIPVPAELRETPKDIKDAENELIGNLKILCGSAEKTAAAFGYTAKILGTEVQGEAREVARELVAKTKKEPPKTVLIMGGETTVTVKGTGKGGRNQEFALAAAKELDGTEGITVFAFGSDGTDGPTDAAGGIADGSTAAKIRLCGKTADEYLDDNDSYEALKIADALIVTGPTGTNVNDLYCAIID